MKFSINIPAYNSAKYIEETFASILSQTYQDFEVVVVDDGSTDETPEILDRWAEKDGRWKVFHQSNQGQMRARCNAVKENKGDYALFVDGDDLLEKDALATLLDKITRYGRPDMLIFKYSTFDGRCKALSPSMWENDAAYNGSKTSDLLSKACYTNAFNSLWTKAIKLPLPSVPETLLDRCAEMRMGEDAIQSIFYMRNAKSIVLLESSLYVYRLSDSSVTNSVSKEKTARDIASIKLMLDYKKETLEKTGSFNEERFNELRLYYLKAYTYIAAIAAPDDRECRIALYKICKENFLSLPLASNDRLSSLYCSEKYKAIDRRQMMHLKASRIKRWLKGLVSKKAS